MRKIKYITLILFVFLILNNLYPAEIKEYIISQDGKYLYLTDFTGKNIKKCKFPTKLIPKYISGENGLLCGLGVNEFIYFLNEWGGITEYSKVEDIRNVLFVRKTYENCCSNQKEYYISFWKNTKLKKVLCPSKGYNYGIMLHIIAEFHKKILHKKANDIVNKEKHLYNHDFIIIEVNGSYKTYFGELNDFICEEDASCSEDNDPIGFPYPVDIFFINDDIIAIRSDGEIAYYNIPTKKTRKDKLPQNLVDLIVKKKIKSHDCKQGEVYFIESTGKLDKIFYIYDLKSKKQRKLKIRLPKEMEDKYFDITRDGRYVVGGGIIYDLRKKRKLDFPKEYGVPVKFYSKKSE